MKSGRGDDDFRWRSFNYWSINISPTPASRETCEELLTTRTGLLVSFVPLSFAFIFRFSTSRKARLLFCFAWVFVLLLCSWGKCVIFSSPSAIVCAVLAWRKIRRVAGGQASRERCSHEPPIKGEWLRTCDIDKTFLFYFFNKIFIFFN